MDKDNQNVGFTKLAEGNVQLNYIAKYYAVGASEPGVVESNVDFEIIYK